MLVREAIQRDGGERVLRGVGVTTGIAIAPVYFAVAGVMVARVSGTPDEEAAALRAALDAAGRALAKLAATVDEAAADILEFQMVLLDDDDLLAPVWRAIESGIAADVAWRDVIDSEIAAYCEGDDAVFSARAADLADLRDRVVSQLAGEAAEHSGPRVASIVLAKDLAPSRLLELDLTKVAGIALGEGSRTSHVALLARARGIPMVAGLGDLVGLEDARDAVLDVEAGCLMLAPSADTLAAARQNATRLEAAGRRDAEFIGASIRAADDAPVQICMNIDHVSMLDGVSPEHCDGIGLARTEFLFQNGLPDEASQLAVYARLIDWAAGRPVTIRTLDAGGDKPVPGLHQEAESNPFLGVRGVRLMLRNRHVFTVQLRALLRAAALGPLKIMVPMVSEPAEMEAVAALIDEVAAVLEVEDVAYARPQLGMMVEIPAAALCADRFDVAFYSIGSNDLIQYATASARDNAAVAHLARGDHPGVTALIQAVVAAGQHLRREVSVCGDMASDPEDAVRLVGLGVRSLSLAPATLGAVKSALSMASRKA